MMPFFRKFVKILTKDEMKEMSLLLIAMIFLGIIEFIGVGSILPFMQVVSDTESIHQNRILNSIYSIGGFHNDRSFLLALGLGVLLVIIINNVYTAYVNYRIFHFSWSRNASISTRLFDNYLHKPYTFFLSANTSDLEKNLFEEVRIIVTGVLTPLLEMAKNAITIMSVFLLLLYTDPLLALTTIFLLGGAYYALFIYISRYLKRIGKTREAANRNRYKIADEALKGIKELNILGRKLFFIDIFSHYSKKMSKSQADKCVVSRMPKHAFEIIAFGGILLIILYFIALDYELRRIIPILSLYAFAGYRLMPAMQTVFTGVSELRYSQAALDCIINHLPSEKEIHNFQTENSGAQREKRIEKVKSIHAEDVWYSYPNVNEYILKGINFEVKENNILGIIGLTGSGKTTLLDILLGLLEPQKGCFKVNGLKITDSLLAEWRSKIGYVPQEIFLSDDSILQNIAYGIPSELIDQEAVRKASKLAQIHETIISEFSDGYNTVVGERGVKLSGGQRQRIGIARALYHDPDVLVFDEGTSALDNITENDLMNGIQSIAGTKMIIMVAHRLTTLKCCENIILLENGVIVDSGNYEELSGRCGMFMTSEQLPDNN